MSAPRVPYGRTQPGRLAATMLRVLAAEMSDGGRLSRGKKYFSDGHVLDIEIDPGVVTVQVQGSRPDPYEVTVAVAPGEGMPTRREVRVVCECPDDEGTGRHACKHAVAALLALGNEAAIEPEVIKRWRSGDGAQFPTHELETDAEPIERLTTTRQRRELADDRDDGGYDMGARRPVVVDPAVDEIAALLRAPEGGTPRFPSPDLEERVLPADPLLAGVLDDVYDELLVEWLQE